METRSPGLEPRVKLAKVDAVEVIAGARAVQPERFGDHVHTFWEATICLAGRFGQLWFKRPVIWDGPGWTCQMLNANGAEKS